MVGKKIDEVGCKDSSLVFRSTSSKSLPTNLVSLCLILGYEKLIFLLRLVDLMFFFNF